MSSNDHVELVFANSNGEPVFLTLSEVATVASRLEALYNKAAVATGQNLLLQFGLESAFSASLHVRLKRRIQQTSEYIPGFLTPLRPWLGNTADLIQVGQFVAQLVPQLLLSAGVATAIATPAEPADRNYQAAVELSANTLERPGVRDAVADILKAGRAAGVDSLIIRESEAPAISIDLGQSKFLGQIAGQPIAPWPVDEHTGSWTGTITLKTSSDRVTVSYNGNNWVCYLTEVTSADGGLIGRRLAVLLHRANGTVLDPGLTLITSGTVYVHPDFIDPLDTVPENLRMADGVLVLS